MASLTMMGSPLKSWGAEVAGASLHLALYPPECWPQALHMVVEEFLTARG